MGPLTDWRKRIEAASSPRASFTDGERYEWIRGHRGDPLIDSALANSNFDADFDRHIDAAIEITLHGTHEAITSRKPTLVKARRRGEAFCGPSTSIRPGFHVYSGAPARDSHDWSWASMRREIQAALARWWSSPRSTR